MPRFILSTVGTSILTNLIDRKNPTEANWWNTLRDSANLKLNELDPETETVINTLAGRALAKLLKNDAEANGRASAELNGIYGIYGGTLPPNSSDQHWLITTDTAQGQKTGELIRDFLKSQGFTVSIFTPEGLSTKDTESFTTGTKELIRWLEDTVPGYAGYHVIFNLVGGFKSLQGYMNTFGAFYADEVVYIFDAPTADLIKIPRLPIQIDDTVIQNHLVQFALMDAGKLYLAHELRGISETLLEYVEDNGNTYAGLSAWGQLIWNRTKKALLTEELLDFPKLKYEQTFHDDFKKNQRNADKCLKLQETLAKAAHSLEKNCYNLQELSNDGLDVKQLQGYDNIYRFRIGDFRVTWSQDNNQLILRRYGDRKGVYGSP